MEAAIGRLLEQGRPIGAKAIKTIVEEDQTLADVVPDPNVPAPDFDQYDALFETDMELDADSVADADDAVAAVMEIGTGSCRIELQQMAALQV